MEHNLDLVVWLFPRGLNDMCTGNHKPIRDDKARADNVVSRDMVDLDDRLAQIETYHFSARST
jgi:hypothetical protein